MRHKNAAPTGTFQDSSSNKADAPASNKEHKAAPKPKKVKEEVVDVVVEAVEEPAAEQADDANSGEVTE